MNASSRSISARTRGRGWARDHQRQAGEQHRDGQQLAHGGAGIQEAEEGVGLAEQLAHAAGDGVADQEGAGEEAEARADGLTPGQQPQQGEQQQPLHQGLVELAGVARLGAGLGEDHGPGQPVRRRAAP